MIWALFIFLGCATRLASSLSAQPPSFSGDSVSSFGSFKLPDAKPFEVANDMGVGTFAWGEPSRGFVVGAPTSDERKRFGKSLFAAGDLQQAYKILVEGGVSFFETGETYGAPSYKQGQQSEQLIGEFKSQNFRAPADIATTIAPGLLSPLDRAPRYGRRGVVKAIQDSLDRLQVGYVSMVQLGGTGRLYVGGRKKLAAGLAMAKSRGFCDHFGVVNHSAKELEAFHKCLEREGLKVASNQVELSLTNQDALFDGTIGACRRLGVKVLASSPLGGGLATGVYTVKNPSGGKSGVPRFTPKELLPHSRLHMELEQIAKEVGVREEVKATTTQVALNWVRAKGAVPLPGVKTAAHAQEVVDCLKWQLTESEVQRLDRVTAQARSG